MYGKYKQQPKESTHIGLVDGKKNLPFLRLHHLYSEIVWKIEKKIL